MALDAATGNFALTLENLAKLVAASASFRAMVGAADAAAALGYILEAEDVPRELPLEDAVLHPWPAGEFPPAFAWVLIEEGLEIVGEDTGGAGFMPSIPLTLRLVRTAVASESTRERRRRFLNWIGAVQTEMAALAKTDGYLYMTSMRLTDIKTSDREEDEDYMAAEFAVQVW